MRVREALGRRAGELLSIFTGLGARLRHARLFHPDGIVLRARITPLSNGGQTAQLAEAIAGPALVRLSTALWKHGREWPDALGFALRVRSSELPSADAAPGDQDLLFATIRWPITTPFAPIGTNVHDFLANDLHGVAPFEAPGMGLVKLRLLAPKGEHPGRTRVEKLLRAIAEGDAEYVLQARRWRFGARWHDVARIELLGKVEVDQKRLRFSPFRTGRGVVPRGFVQALRVATYAASRLGSAVPRH